MEIRFLLNTIDVVESRKSVNGGFMTIERLINCLYIIQFHKRHNDYVHLCQSFNQMFLLTRTFDYKECHLFCFDNKSEAIKRMILLHVIIPTLDMKRELNQPKINFNQNTKQYSN